MTSASGVHSSWYMCMHDKCQQRSAKCFVCWPSPPFCVMQRCAPLRRCWVRRCCLRWHFLICHSRLALCTLTSLWNLHLGAFGRFLLASITRKFVTKLIFTHAVTHKRVHSFPHDGIFPAQNFCDALFCLIAWRGIEKEVALIETDHTSCIFIWVHPHPNCTTNLEASRVLHQ